jgi:hypothetical protein
MLLLLGRLTECGSMAFDSSTDRSEAVDEESDESSNTDEEKLGRVHHCLKEVESSELILEMNGNVPENIYTLCWRQKRERLGMVTTSVFHAEITRLE